MLEDIKLHPHKNFRQQVLRYRRFTISGLKSIKNYDMFIQLIEEGSVEDCYMTGSIEMQFESAVYSDKSSSDEIYLYTSRQRMIKMKQDY